MTNIKRALAWWESLPLYDANDLERKYGYFGHDIGVTEDEVYIMWYNENKPEPLSEPLEPTMTEPEIKLVRSHVEIEMPNGDSYTIEVTKNAIYINLQSDDRSLVVRPRVSNEVALSAVKIDYAK